MCKKVASLFLIFSLSVSSFHLSASKNNNQRLTKNLLTIAYLTAFVSNSVCASVEFLRYRSAVSKKGENVLAEFISHVPSITRRQLNMLFGLTLSCLALNSLLRLYKTVKN